MFEVVKREIASYEPFVRLKGTDEEAFYAGEAIVITAGLATKCGVTSKPSHVVVADVPASESGVYPEVVAYAILPDMEFMVPATVTVAANLIGSKVTLHTDGLQVTATTTSGVFTITGTDGAKAVTGKFI